MSHVIWGDIIFYYQLNSYTSWRMNSLKNRERRNSNIYFILVLGLFFFRLVSFSPGDPVFRWTWTDAMKKTLKEKSFFIFSPCVLV